MRASSVVNLSSRGIVRWGVMLGVFLGAAGPALAAEVPGQRTQAPEVEYTKTDYTTPRYEPAGFPLIGGNSDIGFMFGVAGTLTRFDEGVKPYYWNMDFLADASLKGGNGGTDVAQQNYLWQWDLPGLFGGKLRLSPLLYFQRTVDQGYFSLGNASPGDRPSGSNGRYFQYIDNEVRARQFARIRLGGPWQLGLSATMRAESPEAYPGSALARDAGTTKGDGSPFIRGLGHAGIFVPAAGFIYDSRDNEIFPHDGSFHQMGLKGGLGLSRSDGIGYGAVSTSFVKYVPLGRDWVFAGRVVGDFMFGKIPFYDLFTAGPFQTYDLIGGPSGIRGVPSGRYLGPIKLVANAEVRGIPLEFSLLHQHFHAGGDVFFDTGRIFSDYTLDSPLDGRGLGLKYGVGGGLYLLWGQAAVFRIEVAYSKDQESANPGFPVGIYVEDGVMF